MAERAKLDVPKPTDPFADTEFFSSGSSMLDLALAGGWAMRRVFNIVGDKSTGKTLMAIEAFANFTRKFPKGNMRYGEAESAFNIPFAETLGFPKTVTRPEEPLETVEDFRDDFKKFLRQGGPSLYILDSLDALSDDAELKKFNKEKKASSDGVEEKEAGSYGVKKAKLMSEMFRLLVGDIDEYNGCLGVISQIRDRIGVTFGETKTRSGGHALDFYASQVIWLVETGKIKRSVRGQERPVAVSILAKNKKCKVGMPFREADFNIIFGYGIDDEDSLISWLSEVKALDKESAKDIRQQIERARNLQNYTELSRIRGELREDAQRIWREIEQELAPPMRKYGP